MSKPSEVTKKIKVDATEIDRTIKKAKRLRKLLKEANSLASELASKDLLKINVEVR